MNKGRMVKKLKRRRSWAESAIGVGRGDPNSFRNVARAVDVATDSGIEWLHVDYEQPLETFYAARGFSPTSAGLIRLGAPLPITVSGDP